MKYLEGGWGSPCTREAPATSMTAMNQLGTSTCGGDIKRLEVLVVEAKDVDLGWVLAE